MLISVPFLFFITVVSTTTKFHLLVSWSHFIILVNEPLSFAAGSQNVKTMAQRWSSLQKTQGLQKKITQPRATRGRTLSTPTHVKTFRAAEESGEPQLAVAEWCVSLYLGTQIFQGL